LTDDAIHEAAERAKSVLRAEQLILRHWLERMTAAQSAELLGCSDATVEYLRRHLQLTRGQANRGGAKPMGRRREVTLRVEVQR
jgi:DNA-binding CsgD family transcriptional regulator